MLDVARRNNNMYPMLSNSALLMSIGSLSKTTTATQNRATTNSRATVKAASLLCQDSSTEIIDVSILSEKTSPPLIQYVEIAEAAGQLYCVDRHVNTSCWLKIVSIAQDCQSCNVLLMTTAEGVVLKAIRSITPGEPLLMWFTENILAMLNMPYLTNINIKGQNHYICHVCNNHFEYPNPLKIHLALKCDRLDSNYLWALLASEFNSLPTSSLSINLFPKLPPFNFELSGSPRASPNRTSPHRTSPNRTSPNRTSPNRTSPNRTSPVSIDSSIVHTPKNTCNKLTKSNSFELSPTSSEQTSPASSTQASPTSPGQLSYCSSSSSIRVSPVKRNLDPRHSAFKPYITQPGSYTRSILPSNEKPMLTPFHVHPPPASTPLRPDSQAAQMETIVSNLGKSKQGHLCIYCGKVYSRKYGLKIHIRTHTGYKPLKCKYCLRPFGDPSNLNKHVRLHADGETPYRCDLCGKVLVRRRDLERHIRSRHQDNMDQISDTSSDSMDV